MEPDRGGVLLNADGALMAIPLFGVQAQGGEIWSLDDQSVVMDGAALAGTGGSAYACTMLGVPFFAGGYARLRRLIQSISHDGAVTVAVTPWRDDQDTGQTITRSLTGDLDESVTVPLAVTGSSFQLAISLTAFDAAAEVGAGEVTAIPRRTQR